jgi:SnoaL-like domain
MTIALTGPVSAFFEAERTQDLEALARCFGEHAVVRDEGRTIEGPDAIKRWMKEAKAKYQHTVEPLAVSDRDGTTVVIARVAGAFPNSPLELEHVFTVEGGRIASLEIR